MSKNFVITIGREYGSGGLEIARRVAAKLGINVYDKELITSGYSADNAARCQGLERRKSAAL